MRRRRQLLRLAPIAWVLALLLAPMAAWLAGVRQPVLQNTPKVAFPAIDRHSLREPTTFAAIDDALLDRLPFRKQAVSLHARIALDGFGDSTSPQVAIGDDGYLYLTAELATCTSAVPFGDLADAYEIVARTFVAAGYRTAVAAPGSKLFLHARDAPEIDAQAERCARAIERAVEERLRRTPGGLSVEPALRAIEATGAPTFLMYDSHWNWRGRLAFARAMLDRIQPGLADAADVRAGTWYERPGDLAALLGIERSEPDRAVLAFRTPARPPAPGSVTLVGDSQLEHVLAAPASLDVAPLAARALPGTPICSWSLLSSGGCDEFLRAARVVLIEKVAREGQTLTQLCPRLVSVAAERIGSVAPGRWASDEEGRGRSSAALTIPPRGTATARAVAPGGDVAPTPRLLRFAVERVAPPAEGQPATVTMVQAPRDGAPVPCATPEAGEGGALLLPVPAGRRLSDLVVQLSAAPGTRLGPPQEIVLDGRRVARP